MTLVDLENNNYLKYKKDIIDLYVHAFTTGSYVQYIDYQSTEYYLDKLFTEGFGLLSFADNIPVGAVIAAPLHFDNEFPAAKCPEIPVEKSLYIAEVMVHEKARGKGLATKMIKELLRQTNFKQYTAAVIRVWEKNLPAVSLYKKLGFREVTTITQIKMSSATETFEMRKLYLHLNLTDSKHHVSFEEI